MQHLDEGQIHAWLDGALDAEEASRVERHAAECATCAAAVAEARGLIAGASRILMALDDTPGGVVPRPAAGAPQIPRRRSESLWSTLRLTPARAAAAAVVFLAAGTALVVANRPNDKHATELVQMVTMPRGESSQPGVMPAPKLSVPVPSVDTLSGSTTASAARIRVGPMRPGRPGSRTEAKTSRTEEVVHDTGTVASAPPSAASGTVASAKVDVTSRKAAERAVVAQAPSVAAPAPARPLDSIRRTVAAAENASTLAAPSTARASVQSPAGCYEIVSDSIAGLPRRLSLDTTRVDATPVDQRRAAAADPVMLQHYPVSAVRDDSRHPIESASWTQLPNGAIRLSIASPARMLELQRTSATTLSGSLSGVAVRLRRIGCPN